VCALCFRGVLACVMCVCVLYMLCDCFLVKLLCAVLFFNALSLMDFAKKFSTLLSFAFPCVCSAFLLSASFLVCLASLHCYGLFVFLAASVLLCFVCSTRL
jgi:hypothetical protein